MRIFLAFLQGRPDHPIPAYSFWEYYIKNGITEAGFEWAENSQADWAKGLVPMSAKELGDWKDQTWTSTINYLKNNPCDLFLAYLYPHMLDHSAIAELKKIGIPTVNFFCDNVREYTKAPKEFESFDLNWVPELKALEMYKAANIAHLHLPMPMWVEPKYRIVPQQELDQVSFIGSQDIQRQLLFEEVFKLHPNFDLFLYGASWKADDRISFSPPNVFYGLKEKLAFQLRFINKNGLNGWLRKMQQRNLSFPYSADLEKALKGKPDFARYTQITQESKVTLGVNRYPGYRHPLHQPDTYSRLRDIEAPMLGACYLTEWTPGIDKLYNLGTEIETYRSAEELIDKATELLKDPEKRRVLRKNGQHKALEELGIPQTVEKIKAHFSLK